MLRACYRLRHFLRLKCRTCHIILLFVLLSGSQIWIWLRRQQQHQPVTVMDQDFGLEEPRHGRERMAVHIAGADAFNYQTRPINCNQIYRSDKAEIIRTSKIGTNSKFYRKVFLQEFKNCKSLLEKSKYILNVSQEEKTFPIAFSILLYKDFFQVERLLRAIYRPHNIYCLHTDAKSSRSLQDNIRRLTTCFDNVFVASKLEDVVYASYSRLQADFNCMVELLRSNVSWKYFINLPSQAYPLKTNAEIVKILKIYNGSNDIEGITGTRMLPERYQYSYHVVTSNNKRVIENTYRKKTPPPHNIQIVKGSAYGVFSRAFVQFVMTDGRVQDFKKWLEDTNSPDEYIWATLNHLKYNGHLNAPGGYRGDPEDKPWLATYATWKGDAPCHGKWVRSICVFGVGDVPNLLNKRQLFANKFYLDYQPAAIHCMEEYYFRKVRSKMSLDTEYYKNLPFVNS